MIDVQHIKRLLDADDPDAVLVVVGGRVEVVPSGAAEESGLVVAARRDVLERLGGDTLADGASPSPEELRRIAEALDTAVTDLGG